MAINGADERVNIATDQLCKLDIEISLFPEIKVCEVCRDLAVQKHPPLFPYKYP